MVMTKEELWKFAERYTAAWCSQNPDAVAKHFAEDGWLRVNGGPKAVGRGAIAEVANSFMRAFPDLEVRLDALVENGGRVEYHWTLTGANTGPGGSGRRVQVSGFESWTLAADGLIAESAGQFDETEYRRQIEGR